MASRGGAPKGNKNAVKTGEYESLYAPSLGAEERALFESLLAADARAQCEHELKLACVRVHKILLRQKRLLESADEDGLVPSSVFKEEGQAGGGEKEIATVKKIPVLFAVQDLEAPIDRVEMVRLRYIRQLREIIRENPPDSGGLAALAAAIDRSAEKIVRDRASPRR